MGMYCFPLFFTAPKKRVMPFFIEKTTQSTAQFCFDIEFDRAELREVNVEGVGGKESRWNNVSLNGIK